MRKNAKGVICALLASMMLATSGGVVSFAEEATTTDTTTEVTETAEATATPEATAAPATKDYTNDTYYNDALKVCTALGIITGYDDGSVKPESTVTRAEMAAIILRMINFGNEATYQNVFTDVTADHWAANTIQTAVEQAIVDGMGDGTFVPDGEVKYEQVIKMIVCAMGYSTDAERLGGYPNGYISVGSTTLSLLDGVQGKVGESMTRGEVIKAVFNAMFAPYRTITDFKNGNPVYTSENTLGVEKFKLYEDKGILTTTPNMSATSTQTKDGVVVIDGVEYRCSLTDIDKYLGATVKFYYIDTTADDPEIIAITDSGKTEEATVDADLLESFSLGSGSTVGEIKVYTSSTSNSTKRYKLSKNVDVIYNGTSLTAAEYASAGKDESFEEFITPDVGTIRLVDYEADGEYDVLFIDSYETMLVTSATAEKVSGKINDVQTTIVVDDGSGDQTVKVTKSGAEATTKNLKKNDVVSIKRNFDETMMEFIVTGETVTGQISSEATVDGEKVINVNGEDYVVDKNAEADVKIGLSAVLYLDAFNRVGYIESSTGTMLSGNEKYGILANIYYEDNGDLTIKMFSQDGEALTFGTSGSVRLWGPTDSAERKVSDDDLYKALSNDSDYISVNENPLKLCRYSLNSEGKLTKIYMAVSSSSDDDALQAYNGNLNGVTATAGMVKGYFIEDGIVQFTVPNDAASRKNPSNYSVTTATASAYTHYENAPDFDYTVADFMDGVYPQVIVKFEGGSNVVTAANAISNAGNPATFMVSKVIEAVDSEGDTVYNVRGYSGGAPVSYTTTTNTGVYNFSASFGDYSDSGSNLVFDATKDDASKFKECVNPGDIFVIGTSGSNVTLLIKLADADGIAKTAITKSEYDKKNPDAGQWQKIISKSNTRDIYYSGFVTDVNIADNAIITLSNNVDNSVVGSVPFDLTTAFGFVTLEVDSNGNVLNVEVDEEDGIDPSEIIPWEEGATEYDYMLFKMHRGSVQPAYVVRIEIVD